VHPAIKAAELLKARGVDAGVADMRFIKPLDGELIKEMAGVAGRLVTAEDNALETGFGSAVLEYLNANAIQSNVLRLGIPDRYIEQGRPDELYEDLGLSSGKMADNIAAWLKNRSVATH
jgi:1-deoxy-D-xylulose-5-phosphate synthase